MIVYHRFRDLRDFGKQNTAETFPEFLSVLRVIDRSDRNPSTRVTQKTPSSFTICNIFALGLNYFPVLLSVCALLARLRKRNKPKVVSGSRVTLPVNFACKPGLSFNPLARVTLAVGLPYLLLNRALVEFYWYSDVNVAI